MKTLLKNRAGRHPAPTGLQFGLKSVFEYMTICAIFLASSAATGMASSVCLMLMALAIWARQGLLALAMLMAASLAADPPGLAGGSAFIRQLMVFVLAGMLCTWYRLRRSHLFRRTRQICDSPGSSWHRLRCGLRIDDTA